ncbi:MAG: 5'-deoxynucleotidase [Lachnospiraceae bacterium]|jgi:5'-deoxynucleotidase|nr:5'-deoxynucleotidase [Lachnospiraceae bacterium]
MGTNFFAMISRMKYIERWALMRNSIHENIAEHSLEVAMIAHALCLIGNKRLGKNYNAEHAAVIALYHDAPEIITGDMPTPVKYFNKEIRSSFGEIEDAASEKLLAMLPEDLSEEYRKLFFEEGTKEDKNLRKIVKAADKISALIKCIEESKTGNLEFVKAKESTEKAIEEMHLEEADIFLKECIPSYQLTLDQLS